MSRSTPIGALRRDEDLDPNTREMVDGIVNELEPQGGSNQGGYPSQYEGMNGQMGPPQMLDYGVPPEEGMYGGYSQGGNPTMLPPGDPRGMGQPQQPMEEYPRGMPYRQEEYVRGSQEIMQPSRFEGLSDMFMNNSKEPILAAVLFLVMSNDSVSLLLSRYIPYAASPLLGLLIRAVIVAGLFFTIKTFVLKK